MSGNTRRGLRRIIGAASASVALVSAVACGGAVAHFEPAHASARVGITYPVTAYKLKVGSAVLGDAVVWSEGAKRVASSEQQVLDLEIKIHNSTSTPLQLDVAGSGVDVRLHDGRRAALGSPRSVGGSRTVAPDSSGRVALHYALPLDLSASDVAGFDFNWRVDSQAGAYAQSTAFVPFATNGFDDLGDRGLPCSGLYRSTRPSDYCLGVPPVIPR